MLFQLHRKGLIVIDTGTLLDSVLDVGWVIIGAGCDVPFSGCNWDGFERSAPCKVIITSLEPYPHLAISKTGENVFSGMFSLAIHCKRNKTAEYEYCVTY